MSHLDLVEFFLDICSWDIIRAITGSEIPVPVLSSLDMHTLASLHPRIDAVLSNRVNILSKEREKIERPLLPGVLVSINAVMKERSRFMCDTNRVLCVLYPQYCDLFRRREPHIYVFREFLERFFRDDSFLTFFWYKSELRRSFHQIIPIRHEELAPFDAASVQFPRH